MFTSASAIRTFVLAGHGHLTLSSVRTGERFTYRVRSAKEGPNFFVSLLVGPDNESSYKYLGLLSPDARGLAMKLWHTPRSCALPDAPSFKAFSYLASRVLSQPDQPLPAGLEVRHDGRCGRCHRLLTVPASVDSGIGPECARHLGLRCT